MMSITCHLHLHAPSHIDYMYTSICVCACVCMNVVGVVSVEVLSAWPMKCAYAVQEIFKTEADYVLALKDLIQVSVVIM